MDRYTKAGLAAQGVLDSFLATTSVPSDMMSRVIFLSAELDKKVSELQQRGVSESAIYRDETVKAMYQLLIEAITAVGLHPVSLRDFIVEAEQELHDEPPVSYDDDGLPLWVPLMAGAVLLSGVAKHGGGRVVDDVPLEVSKENLPNVRSGNITVSALDSLKKVISARESQITLAGVELLKSRAKSVARQTGERLKWVAELDKRTCRACLALHGQVFDSSDVIPTGHPNCRCVVVLVPEDYESSDQEARRYLAKLSGEERKRLLGIKGAEKYKDGNLNLAGGYTIRVINGQPTVVQGRVNEL